MINHTSATRAAWAAYKVAVAWQIECVDIAVQAQQMEEAATWARREAHDALRTAWEVALNE